MVYNNNKRKKGIYFMSDTIKLQPKDVKDEVKRIKKLPKEEQEAQMNALQDKIKTQIDNYYDKIGTMDKFEQNNEENRLTYCTNVLRWKWEKPLWDYRFKKKTEWKNSVAFKEHKSQNPSQYLIKKVNTAHESGLPLPEQAEVDIWWKDDRLIFASASTEFSLPVERIMGMGMTTEKSAYYSIADKTHLTIEYKKGDEIKSIVVWVTYKAQVSRLIRHFDEIKGTREAIKQEL